METHVYLDLNVFDLIEKRNSIDEERKVIYSNLYNLIENEKILTPYSNAHINDLKRAYKKNSERTIKHLDNIKFLSNDLCIVNYWGDLGVTWHYRDILEFFETSLQESDLMDQTFEEFLDNAEFGSFMKLSVTPLKLQFLPKEFISSIESEPILKMIYPKTCDEQTVYALCKDLFHLNTLLTKDYSLFKKLKQYINNHRLKWKKEEKYFKFTEKLHEKPKSLQFNDSLDLYIERSQSAANPIRQNVLTSYFRKNFEGFKADEVYLNSIDDALHTYYASHCDFFLTNDDKCMFKAEATFNDLKINTKVMTPKSFIENFE
ncbi:hypothetical protein KJK34_08805 [Flavobacterium sp. D11R37]|uniref:hypothetical protein n=1 Tax=Flavobacterium coralii TaxID=2838017 RepID=UPI001CA6BCD5|nr:hypothetical protein [Flavobacterium coralii]MBY8962846.1 hypothetical protein [Flavobacterium coralii]